MLSSVTSGFVLSQQDNSEMANWDYSSLQHSACKILTSSSTHDNKSPDKAKLGTIGSFLFSANKCRRVSKTHAFQVKYSIFIGINVPSTLKMSCIGLETKLEKMSNNAIILKPPWPATDLFQASRFKGFVQEVFKMFILQKCFLKFQTYYIWKSL